MAKYVLMWTGKKTWRNPDGKSKIVGTDSRYDLFARMEKIFNMGSKGKHFSITIEKKEGV